MNKFLQTVIFFTLVSVMVTFIYSALRPAQYLAESEFLVISNSIEADCDKELGATLARAIISETFQKDLENIQVGENKLIVANYVKVKNYKNSNIINVRTRGTSLADTQKLSENIQKTLLSQGGKYYSAQDKIVIQTLISSKIIRTPKVILENTLKGLFAGIVLGTIITFSTGLRLNIFTNDKNVNLAQKKIREKKSKQDRSSNGDYTAIIKNRLEKELSKEPIEDLALVDDGYVFKQRKAVTEKVAGKINEIQTLSNKKRLKEGVQEGGEQGVDSSVSDVRVIAASTMIVGKHDKEIEADKVPDNLPIFIEENLPVEEVKKEIVSEEIVRPNQDNGEDIAKTSGELQEKLPIEKPSTVVPEINTRNENVNTTPGSKKASAHDIANGFAPDLEGENGPSNEEIKDRLNRLLRGEL